MLTTDQQACPKALHTRSCTSQPLPCPRLYVQEPSGNVRKLWTLRPHPLTTGNGLFSRPAIAPWSPPFHHHKSSQSLLFKAMCICQLCLCTPSPNRGALRSRVRACQHLDFTRAPGNKLGVSLLQSHLPKAPEGQM